MYKTLNVSSAIIVSFVSARQHNSSEMAKTTGPLEDGLGSASAVGTVSSFIK